jgi:hypothetical protein
MTAIRESLGNVTLSLKVVYSNIRRGLQHHMRVWN